MKIKTTHGTARTEKKKRLRWHPISHVLIDLTFAGEDGTKSVLTLRRYGPRSRADLTAAWIRKEVAEGIAKRDDLVGMTLLGVDVKAVESVWATPFADIWGEESAGA